MLRLRSICRLLRLLLFSQLVQLCLGCTPTSTNFCFRNTGSGASAVWEVTGTNGLIDTSTPIILGYGTSYTFELEARSSFHPLGLSDTQDGVVWEANTKGLGSNNEIIAKSARLSITPTLLVTPLTFFALCVDVEPDRPNEHVEFQMEPSCSDLVQNGDEEDIDCGGALCDVCPTCFDGIKNQDESDVDCGGSCIACPTCVDQIKNGNEIQTDCGGPDCPRCVCPGSPECSGNGICSNTTVLCECDSPWIGPACEFSSATSCSDHGTVDFAGQCTCESNFAGSSCDVCASDHYQYSGTPPCKFCLSTTTCSSHGTCDADGDCECMTNYQTTDPMSGVFCDECLVRLFGAFCDQLCPGYDGTDPNTACSGVGTCDEGLTGNGACTCSPGYAGPACEFSDAVTCNGNGQAQSDGSCSCDTEFSGEFCAECAVDHFDYPNCNFCQSFSSCNGHGICDALGDCECSTAFDGASCELCSADHYGFPACNFCDAASTCNGYGSCSAVGECTCLTAFGGAACQECAPDYYGWPNCKFCEASSTCNDNGVCDSVGDCQCTQGYLGEACVDPFITSVVPIGGDRSTKGGYTMRILGRYFGVSGSIAVNGVAVAVLSFYSDTEVRFEAPPMQPTAGTFAARITVTRDVDGTGSNSFDFSLNAPTVTSIDPPQGCDTDGTSQLVLTGTNFGLLATVSLDGVVVAPDSQTHESIVVTCLPGVGDSSSHGLEVDVSGRTSSNVGFNYAIPEVTGVDGTISAAGGVITVLGNNFGTDALDQAIARRRRRRLLAAAPPSVTIGGLDCPITARSHTALECILAPGGGADVPVRATVASQDSAVFLIDFDLPTVSSATGCENDAESCRAGSTLVITGTSFGPSIVIGGLFSDLVVTITGIECRALVMDVPHTQLTCTLDAAVNTDLTVVVARGPWNVTFARTLVGPIIDSNSITMLSLAKGGSPAAPAPAPGGGDYVVGSDLAGGDTVRLQGSNFGTDPEIISVTYGPPSQASKYSCDNVRDRTPSALTCDTTAGAGKGLVFQVTVKAVQSDVSADQLWYPEPAINGSSLRSWVDNPNGPGTASLEIASSQGGVLAFDGENFGGAGTQTVTYSSDLSSTDYPCAVQAAFTTDTRIVCRTGSIPSDGYTDIRFTVSVGAGGGSESDSTRQSSVATDVFKYPTTPLITNLTATSCTQAGVAVTDCPVTGLDGSGDPVSLTINGVNFGPSSVVTIGGKFGLNVENDASNPTTRLTCTLPAGVGSELLVTVSGSGVFSPALPILSYSAPRIDSITGCSATGDVLVLADCDRFGASRLTVTGEHFGPQPQVRVGGSICTAGAATATPDTVVECTVPAGTEQGLSIFVFNGADTSTDNAALSYALCAIGEITNATGGGTGCVQCPPGKYGSLDPTGEPNCFECASNKVSTAAGSTECTLCAAGQYAENNECKDCVEGTYSAAEGATACWACDRGRYVSYTGASACDECSEGTFQNQTGQQGCFQCARGRYSADKAAVQCFDCPRGYRGPAQGAAACLACTAGRSNNQPGSQTCPLCIAGKYSDRQASEECESCYPGRFSTQGAQACTECEPGFFAAGTGSQGCDSCLAGTFSLAQATACLDCARGSFSAANESSTCTSCPAGEYQPDMGQEGCSLCPPGTFSNTENADRCLPCPPGSVAAGWGQNSCVKCSAGNYSVAPDSPSVGSTACAQCDAGRFNPRSGQDACDLCGPGTYNGQLGAEKCEYCEIGKYAAVPGSQDCTNCSDGRVAASTGSVSCVQCAVGRASNGDTTTCSPCAPGLYQDTPGQASCVECMAGKEARFSGSVQCRDCEGGRFSNDTGTAECDTCPRGRFSAVNAAEGLTACTECGAGTFSTSAGTSSCVDCPAGRFGNTTRASECTLCEPGTDQQLPGQSECNACPAGKSAASSGLVACLDCVPGYYAEFEGTEKCTACPLGRFANLFGQDECTPCPTGFYNPSRGQSKCLPCPAGTSTDGSAEGQERCIPCQPGTYKSTAGLGSCLPCPQGTHAQGYFSEECEPCREGTFSNVTGKVVCDECPPGSISNTLGGRGCSACVAGRVQPASGRASCTECQPGTSQALEGQVSCDNCAAGLYQDQLGRSMCTECPKGTYSLDGQATCAACPARSVAKNPGTALCTPCPEDSVTNDEQTACVCDAGLFSSGLDSAGNATCAVCPAGLLCDTPGQTEDALVLEAGYWRSDSQSLTLFRCLQREHCEGGALGECAPHRVGDICAVCEDGYTSATSTGECEKCLGQGTSIGVSIAIMLAFGLGLSLLFFIVLRSSVQPDDGTCESNSASADHGGGSGGLSGSGGDMDPKKRSNNGKSSRKHSNGGKPSRKHSSGGTNGRVSPCISPYISPRLGGAASPTLTVPDSGSMISNFSNLHRKRSSMVSYCSDGMRPSRDASHRSSRKGSAFDRKFSPDLKLEDLHLSLNKRARLRHSGTRRRPNVTYKLKIAIGFLQILSSLSLDEEVRWPSGFQKFMRAFDFVNFQFVPWQSVQCVATMDYYSKLLIAALTPPAILVLLVLLFLIPMKIKSRYDYSDDDTQRKLRLKRKRQFWKLTLFTAFLVYPAVSHAMLAMFRCKKVSGNWFLVADFNLKCFDSRWWTWMPVATFFSVLYPLGIPLVYFIVLKKNEYRLHEGKIRMQYGFLYEAYHYDHWWFELLDMANKMFLVSIVRFVPLDRFKLPTALIWTSLFIGYSLVRPPWLRHGDDRLHLLSQTVILMVVLLGYTVTQFEDWDQKTETFVSILLIAAVIMFLIAFIVISLRNLRKVFWRDRQRRRRKRILQNEDGLDNDSTNEEDEDNAGGMLVDTEDDDDYLFGIGPRANPPRAPPSPPAYPRGTSERPWSEQIQHVIGSNLRTMPPPLPREGLPSLALPPPLPSFQTNATPRHMNAEISESSGTEYSRPTTRQLVPSPVMLPLQSPGSPTLQPIGEGIEREGQLTTESDFVDFADSYDHGDAQSECDSMADADEDEARDAVLDIPCFDDDAPPDFDEEDFSRSGRTTAQPSRDQ